MVTNAEDDVHKCLVLSTTKDVQFTFTEEERNQKIFKYSYLRCWNQRIMKNYSNQLIDYPNSWRLINELTNRLIGAAADTFQ